MKFPLGSTIALILWLVMSAFSFIILLTIAGDGYDMLPVAIKASAFTLSLFVVGLAVVAVNFGLRARRVKRFTAFFGFRPPHPDDGVTHQYLAKQVDDVLTLWAMFCTLADDNRVNLKAVVTGPEFQKYLALVPPSIQTYSFTPWYANHENALCESAGKSFLVGVRLAWLAGFKANDDFDTYVSDAVLTEADQVVPVVQSADAAKS